MGLFNGKPFASSHILHHTRFFDNKLYIYLPEHDKFFTFQIYKGDKKFNFYGQQSISVSSGAIYLVGGQSYSDGQLDLVAGAKQLTSNLLISGYVAKINLNKHEDFVIDIEHMKPCEPMPEPRASHLLVNLGQFIYAIGGYLRGHVQTRSCLKFDKKEKKWSNIASMGSSEGLNEPCGIAVGESIYIFETAVKKNVPRIHKYSIEADSWSELIISLKHKTIEIPPTYSGSVFQISQNELMILGGMTQHQMEDKNEQKEDPNKRVSIRGRQEMGGHYYIFDMHKEEISDFRYDSFLNAWGKEDKQGNLDYSHSSQIFARLSDGYVKTFKKSNKKWSEHSLKAEESWTSGGCCSKRK